MDEWETLGIEGERGRQPGRGEPPNETLQLGDDEAGPDKPPKRLRCRLGAHHWEARQTEDGRTYNTCTICGEDEYHGQLIVGVTPWHD